jgi:predicted nucleotidyltransferase
MLIEAKDLENDQPLLSLEEIYQRLNVLPEQIVNFCQKWQIVELALFGSILRHDFQGVGENKSDVDILFTYGETAHKNLILQIKMQYELEDLFGRSVDLVSKTALFHDSNYIRRQNILNSARIIYGTR